MFLCNIYLLFIIISITIVLSYNTYRMFLTFIYY